MEDPVLHQAHVPSRRLQERELVGERTFERYLAHVHRSALALAMVVRVVAIAAFRPAAGEWTAADVAAHETTQRKVGMIPLPRAGDNNAAVEHGLGPVERCFIDDGLEVALR